MKNSTLVLTLTAALMFGTAVTTASAQILAQDYFNSYTTGTIIGQTGKTVDQPGGSVIGFGSVTSSTATTWAGSTLATVSPGAFYTPSVGRVDRPFASSVSSVTTGTVWAAFTLSFGGAAGVYDAFELATTPGNGDVNALRLYYNNGVNFGLGVANASGGLSGVNLGAFSTGATQFFMKIDFTDDIVTAYQASGSTIVASASLPFDSSFTLGGLQSAAFGTAASTTLNNFRLGNSFADVPEPSTWALMGLGLLGLVWRLRRNKLVA